ncbi:NADH-quinone oxidoreductase subunit C, partial [Salmonella enterica subsp. enterica serovar Anatum]|nr:NADH-quinone oxidoreductase subunit C [Salmonella enterica subsp. enterica serovar Anatum]
PDENGLMLTRALRERSTVGIILVTGRCDQIDRIVGLEMGADDMSENDLRVPTFTKLFPNANWYERETWEMFGIDIEGHPHLTRI